MGEKPPPTEEVMGGRNRNRKGWTRKAGGAVSWDDFKAQDQREADGIAPGRQLRRRVGCPAPIGDGP